ncbi:MAG TPA: X2-like carbohydrate binding domain-containing protein [Clostridia bacterium]|nr:X2-like carbohydrate binding domain-containing protein [Clostridia bacterium]
MRESSIYNKKGFTLLELLIAVSIFGIILVMTFSIINYVPKLAKTESSQYSERTDVRRALTEITGTIQNASTITFPSIEFTMPSGEEISYEYNGKNVNKIVNGTPYKLMESVDEFEITAEEDHLFNIHIKTSKEGKDYDFKVERRRDGSTKSDAEISTISPATAVFDKKNPQVISITLNLNGNELNNLWNGLNKLTLNTDYSISESVVTLKEGYLKAQSIGIINIRFDVSNGVDPELSVEIKDTSAYIKIEGNSYEDDLARMNYPGNLQIDPFDNTWVLTVTNGTLASVIDKDDLKITELPYGIKVTAAKVKNENKILITLSDSASAPVTTTKSVEIIILGSAVGTSASNSDPIKVFLLPGASYAPPEHNLMFTNDFIINSKSTIEGDVVIGRGKTLTAINSKCDIYGYLYVDSSLTVNSSFTVGKRLKKKKLFVKGTVDIESDTTINGDLFYRDTLITNSKLTVKGVAEQRAVEIPEVSIPKPRPEQWYKDNGYTIINNSGTTVNLVDNGKYYFKDNYWFNSPNTGFDNVTIVGMSNITINSNFFGSGILFTPYGKIVINSSTDFEGMCVSQVIDIESNTELKFKRYTELPFDQDN